jgi:hypothetical protein
MVFNATFNNISVIVVFLYWLRKLDYPMKTTAQSQVTVKRHHLMLFRLHLV